MHVYVIKSGLRVWVVGKCVFVDVEKKMFGKWKKIYWWKIFDEYFYFLAIKKIR